jgi:hypothetical protein
MEDRGYGAVHLANAKCPISDLAIDVDRWNRRAALPPAPDAQHNRLDVQITGPDPDGGYYLGLSAAGESCWIDIGKPQKMVETALLMAASAQFRGGPLSAKPTTTEAQDLPDAVEALVAVQKHGAGATATAMILHIAETLQSKGKAVLTTGDDFGAQVLGFAAALAAIRAGGKP